MAQKLRKANDRSRTQAKKPSHPKFDKGIKQMMKYNGFTACQMLEYIGQQGLTVEASTEIGEEGERIWRVALTGNKYEVFDGSTLFRAVKGAFERFAEGAVRERKEAQAALNKIIRMAREPNHHDAPENFCTACCGQGKNEIKAAAIEQFAASVSRDSIHRPTLMAIAKREAEKLRRPGEVWPYNFEDLYFDFAEHARYSKEEFMQEYQLRPEPVVMGVDLSAPGSRDRAVCLIKYEKGKGE